MTIIKHWGVRAEKKNMGEGWCSPPPKNAVMCDCPSVKGLSFYSLYENYLKDLFVTQPVNLPDIVIKILLSEDRQQA